jgi:hypothetical protein
VFLNFVKKKVLTPFAMMYMFINTIFTKYINAHIHQELNPRPHGNMPRFLITKPLQDFTIEVEKI